MLVVHTSNRLEVLAHELAELIKGQPLPPLAGETVVTQSVGMGRWLSLTLAEELGVVANMRFPFPAKFAEEELARMLPMESVPPVFRREVLPWRIHAVLPSLLEDPDFAELQNYTGDDPDKLWQLCKQLAATFDRYIAHRPQMLREWDADRAESSVRWQSRLWRAVADGAAHPAALIHRAGAQIHSPPAPRCSIFGLSSLAPTYLEFLAALGAHREVHLFMLAPTQHYWGDVQSEREKARFIQWCERRGKIGGAEHIEEGHPLLASLGKVGRDFHEALTDISASEGPDLFVPSSGGSLLSRLQDDILELRPHADDREILPSDDSIRLHSCHSPVRELEVLHDQLLALFDADPTLTPRDVLVAVPEIEDYAPFIEGVFGAPESDAVRFPYSIADREVRAESGVADAFLRVLELVDSRFPATAVLALLNCPAVHTRFELGEDDLALVRQWIVSSGIRWGRDAAHRAELDLPARNEHTWAFGMDRLVLGFALPGDGTSLFEGILPEPAVEGSLAAALGRFASFTRTLFDETANLRTPRPAAEWAAALQATLLALCDSDYDLATQWREVSQSLATLAESAALAGHSQELPFAVIRDCVTDLIAGAQRAGSFLRGGVTFCSLRPMRAIPHRIICLLGMNDGAFPRQDRAPAFDITASQPRPGDRSTRDDDRYLFLEALLSARDRLVISWCGQSARDNSPQPPSVIVSELLDVLGRAYNVTAESLTTRHRLQPFSPHYFADGPLFSYSAENALGAASSHAHKPAPPFAAALSEQDLSRDITLERLTDALTRSSQFFARERLGIHLPFDEPQPEDVEPLEIAGLEKYALSTLLADAQMSGTPDNALLPAITASGALPHGFAGASIFHDTALDVRELTSLAAIYSPGPTQEPVAFSIAIGDWKISGSLRTVTRSGLLAMRPAKLKGHDFLRAWIQHLVLCIVAPAEVNARTVLIGKQDTFEFRAVPPGDAVAHLHALLILAAVPFSKPLPLFPCSSLAFADYKLDQTGRKTRPPIDVASDQWFGSRHTQAEAEDEWNALVWRDVPDPLNEEFERVALAVFAPLLKHRTKLSPKGASKAG